MKREDYFLLIRKLYYYKRKNTMSGYSQGKKIEEKLNKKVSILESCKSLQILSKTPKTHDRNPKSYHPTPLLSFWKLLYCGRSISLNYCLRYCCRDLIHLLAMARRIPLNQKLWHLPASPNKYFPFPKTCSISWQPLGGEKVSAYGFFMWTQSRVLIFLTHSRNECSHL